MMPLPSVNAIKKSRLKSLDILACIVYTDIFWRTRDGTQQNRMD